MFGDKIKSLLKSATDIAKQKAVEIAKGVADSSLLSTGAVYAAKALGGPVVGGLAIAAKAGYDYALKGSDYKSDDPYLTQDLKSAAIINCKGDVRAEKWRRRKVREQLIAQGKSSGDPKKKEAAERLERDMVAVERARLSSHVYDINDPKKQPPPEPPVGFLEPSPEELSKLGLTKDALSPKGSDFRAQVYKVDPEVNEVPPEYIVAYRGTVTGNDWKENAKQGIGMESDSYNRAMNIASKMRKATKKLGQSFETTGHSLGGGLASSAAVVTGARATTFNSAGLHDNTTASYGNPLDREAAKKTVNAYRIEGAEKTEILTSVQKLPLVPDAIGEPRSVRPPDEGASRLSLHGMDTMIDGIEQQKIQDQATLNPN
ncbi:MAG: hypothetical protein FD134_645 [Gallionellaceae bacterium]|nr:MAG: hypothetical protein FD134_645 [Gallionellaceae bacterium]